jgi:hypothetical protein
MIFYSSFFGYAKKTKNTIKNKTGFITTKKIIKSGWKT